MQYAFHFMDFILYGLLTASHLCEMHQRKVRTLILCGQHRKITIVIGKR